MKYIDVILTDEFNQKINNDISIMAGSKLGLIEATRKITIIDDPGLPPRNKKESVLKFTLAERINFYFGISFNL